MANTQTRRLSENKIALIKILEENNVNCSFCLKENKEDAIDIDFEESWRKHIVYLFTRGHRDILYRCDSFLEAARYLVEIEKPKKSTLIMEQLKKALNA